MLSLKPLCAAEAHLHIGDGDCVVVVRQGGEVNLEAAVSVVRTLVVTGVEAVHLRLAAMATNSLSLVLPSIFIESE